MQIVIERSRRTLDLVFQVAELVPRVVNELRQVDLLGEFTQENFVDLVESFWESLQSFHHSLQLFGSILEVVWNAFSYWGEELLAVTSEAYEKVNDFVFDDVVLVDHFLSGLFGESLNFSSSRNTFGQILLFIIRSECISWKIIAEFPHSFSLVIFMTADKILFILLRGLKNLLRNVANLDWRTNEGILLDLFEPGIYIVIGFDVLHNFIDEIVHL